MIFIILKRLNKKLGKQLSPEGGDISALYMDDGYLFFQVDPVETAVYNDTIDHEIRIMEGPQATIKNINISGNDKTKEYVIRREIRTVPGEKFSRSDLIRSQRELATWVISTRKKLASSRFQTRKMVPWISTILLKKNHLTSWSLLPAGVVVSVLPVHWVLPSTTSLIKNIFHKEAWDPLPAGDGQKLSLRFQSNGRFFRS